MEAIVLAGGVGKRLLPLTQWRPKPYLPLAGKPLYMYAVEQIAMVRGLLDRAVMVAPQATPPPRGQCRAGWPLWSRGARGWRRVSPQPWRGSREVRRLSSRSSATLQGPTLS
ncbi:sugar phosphate nucleotidyltransferase [Aeropyrum camini]|uniref:sugar phosphate nucleotidyltransferase n=1 Tax=Aeropyrum camini TaxID=229980 RepID=UPI0009E7E237|nr:sugar phosphate nucleotidyltransferase [Aeropyrum camini]